MQLAFIERYLVFYVSLNVLLVFVMKRQMEKEKAPVQRAIHVASSLASLL